MSAAGCSAGFIRIIGSVFEHRGVEIRERCSSRVLSGNAGTLTALLELLVASSILILLATVAMPMARVTIIRRLRAGVAIYRLRKARFA